MQGRKCIGRETRRLADGAAKKTTLLEGDRGCCAVVEAEGSCAVVEAGGCCDVFEAGGCGAIVEAGGCGAVVEAGM